MSSTPPPIARIGKYEIESVLGKGAMGVVYRARDPFIERTVAVKTVRKDLLSDDAQGDLMERFRTEAQAAGRLTHQNIVAVYDYGEDDVNSYIVMEFVRGKSLAALLKDGAITHPEWCMRWMTELLEALAHAHEKGVVHRDIKPSNLLITQERHLKIADFGVARLDTASATRMGTVVGTPTHMAPEQFRGERVSGSADLFSAGVVLYQLLTGAKPFDGSAATVMHRIMYEEATPPTRLNPALPAAVDTLLERALAKRPQDRFANASEFLAAMTQALGSVIGDDARTVVRPRPEVPTGAGQTPTGAGQAATGSSHSRSPTATDPRATTSSGSRATQPPDTSAGHGMPSQGWSSETLTMAEQELAKSIGPLARVIVKRASQQTGDVATLWSSLAEHVPEGPERTQFKARAETLRRKAAGATGSGTMIGSRPSAADATDAGSTGLPASGITPEMVDQAERHLANLVGPIAKLLVKRALRDARNEADFRRLCAEHIPDAGQRLNYLLGGGGDGK